MTYAGIVCGNTIELENRTELPDGTRVHVGVVAQSMSQKGSPQAVLRLAGTLTDEEADVLPIDPRTAERFAFVLAQLRRDGRPIATHDVWIAGVLPASPHELA